MKGFRGIVRPDDKPPFLGRFPAIIYQGATGGAVMSNSEYVKLSDLVELSKLTSIELESVFSQIGVVAERKRTEHKQRIAEKIMAGIRLSVEEKEVAYEALTGKHPENRKGKGRTSTIERDAKLAYSYLISKNSDRYKRKSKVLKHELAKMLRLPSSEIDSIDKAIRRGKKYLREQYLPSLSVGDLTAEERRGYDDMISLLGGSS